MTFRVVSYVPASLLASESSNAPVLACKFVIVREPEDTWLIVGRVRDYKYHAHLLDRFCREHRIPAGRVPGSDTIEVHDREVRVEGGGKVDIDAFRRHLRCYGHSAAYGPFSPQTVRSAFSGDPDWRRYALEVDGRR
jgi:hypothetical protein